VSESSPASLWPDAENKVKVISTAFPPTEFWFLPIEVLSIPKSRVRQPLPSSGSGGRWSWWLLKLEESDWMRSLGLLLTRNSDGISRLITTRILLRLLNSSNKSPAQTINHFFVNYLCLPRGEVQRTRRGEKPGGKETEEVILEEALLDFWCKF